jgi:hypothetical protein
MMNGGGNDFWAFELPGIARFLFATIFFQK